MPSGMEEHARQVVVFELEVELLKGPTRIRVQSAGFPPWIMKFLMLR